MEKQTQLSESYKTKYEHYEHSVGVMMLHLEWVTKYRYKMFRKQEYLKIAEACIRKSAFEHKIKIIKISVMPEHVHCVVQVALSISASKVLQILKGRSSYLFFRLHEKARLRYPRGHLWGRGKFASSVGFTNLEVVNKYVENQTEHHSLGNSTL
jgi:putative transposase